MTAVSLAIDPCKSINMRTWCLSLTRGCKLTADSVNILGSSQLSLIATRVVGVTIYRHIFHIVSENTRTLWKLFFSTIWGWLQNTMYWQSIWTRQCRRDGSLLCWCQFHTSCHQCCIWRGAAQIYVLFFSFSSLNKYLLVAFIQWHCEG